jgi:hypothetical protein
MGFTIPQHVLPMPVFIDHAKYIIIPRVAILGAVLKEDATGEVIQAIPDFIVDKADFESTVLRTRGNIRQLSKPGDKFRLIDFDAIGIAGEGYYDTNGTLIAYAEDMTLEEFKELFPLSSGGSEDPTVNYVEGAGSSNTSTTGPTYLEHCD